MVRPAKRKTWDISKPSHVATVKHNLKLMLHAKGLPCDAVAIETAYDIIVQRRIGEINLNPVQRDYLLN
jgi:hypothetical protein